MRFSVWPSPERPWAEILVDTARERPRQRPRDADDHQADVAERHVRSEAALGVGGVDHLLDRRGRRL
ncbi:MAG TPA: hypothetical protein VGL32_05895, partial [Acidimicrobiales bacterium]